MKQVYADANQRDALPLRSARVIEPTTPGVYAAEIYHRDHAGALESEPDPSVTHRSGACADLAQFKYVTGGSLQLRTINFSPRVLSYRHAIDDRLPPWSSLRGQSLAHAPPSNNTRIYSVLGAEFCQ